MFAKGECKKQWLLLQVHGKPGRNQRAVSGLIQYFKCTRFWTKIRSLSWQWHQVITWASQRALVLHIYRCMTNSRNIAQCSVCAQYHRTQLSWHISHTHTVASHIVACIAPQGTSSDQQVPHLPWDKIRIEKYESWANTMGCFITSHFRMQHMGLSGGKRISSSQCGNILTSTTQRWNNMPDI